MGWNDHMTVKSLPMHWNVRIELAAWATENETKNSQRDAGEMNLSSLYMGMVRVLGERNK